MNDENLKKGVATQFKSGEQAVMNGKKGGIASGKAKREKKLLKDYILDKWDKDKTVDQLLAILQDGVAKDADFLKALEFARDTVGEKPTEKVEVGKLDKSQSMNELKELFDD